MTAEGQNQPVLVLNAGSSSIKAALFEGKTETLRDAVGGIGTEGGPADHKAALQTLLDRLSARGLRPEALFAVGHRVVHGGEALTRPVRLMPSTRDQIAACIPLAPLHNPHHLAAIDALAALVPDLPQVACFDTAFHAGQTEVARSYALPDRPETAQIKRYGFHGLSYASLVTHWIEATGLPLPKRLLAFHLGNGASACAILHGRSAATTMGYSPLDGLTMGTRSGSLDPNAVLYLAETLGVEATRDMLNREAGLLGLSGVSADMQALRGSDDTRAVFAIDHFCYWAARQGAALIPAMGGVDALAFTGGIGENDREIRAQISNLLAWAGKLEQFVIPTREEAQIARETRACLSGNLGEAAP